jgi:TetR/AcrR family transcriptional repressor of nem operon
MAKVGSRERVLAVAEDLFYRQGFLATSVDEIVAQARVSKSNFYYHFRSKEELGLDVLDRRAASLREEMDRSLCDPSLSPRDRLQSFLASLIRTQEEWLRNGGCPFGNMVVEVSEHHESMRRRLSELFRGLHRSLTSVVEEGQELGEFRNGVAASDLAALVLQAVQGMQLMTKCEKTIEPARRSAELLMMLLAVR